jgi:hypothetical protein
MTGLRLGVGGLSCKASCEADCELSLGWLSGETGIFFGFFISACLNQSVGKRNTQCSGGDFLPAASSLMVQGGAPREDKQGSSQHPVLGNILFSKTTNVFYVLPKSSLYL